LRYLVEKFKKGAHSRKGMAVCVASTNLQTWEFWSVDISYRRRNYWILFGKSETRFRQNMIVEINPPREGINRNVQESLLRDQSADDGCCMEVAFIEGQKRITKTILQGLPAEKDQKFATGWLDKFFTGGVHRWTTRRGPTAYADFVSACNFVRLHTRGGISRVNSEEVEDFAQSNRKSESPRSASLRRGDIDPKHAACASSTRLSG